MEETLIKISCRKPYAGNCTMSCEGHYGDSECIEPIRVTLGVDADALKVNDEVCFENEQAPVRRV